MDTTKMAKIAIKEVGKPLKIVEATSKYRTDSCKPYTGQKELVEYVNLNEEGTLTLAVNECGLMLNLPTNFLIKLNNPFFPIQTMVGTVIFTRVKYVNVYEEEIWDFELEDLTSEDICAINKLLAEEIQHQLILEYISNISK